MIEFIDLKKQQARIKDSLDAAIQRVMSHGQYILGPEVAELEAKLASF
ncbi:aminotransferase DegT, partial [Pseudomonas sp. CM25]|nr:aminotransferase DegT [Pseudomonas sp. CM25]